MILLGFMGRVVVDARQSNIHPTSQPFTEPLRSVVRVVLLIVAIVSALAVGPDSVSAKEYRSREVTREFQREHPCPPTGEATGACPGYRKDHIVPLACGGRDAVSNLQWQTVSAARAKDRWERRGCAR